jgi:hypothetical protein
MSYLEMEILTTATIKTVDRLYDLIDEANTIFVSTDAALPAIYVVIDKDEAYRLIGQNFNSEKGFVLSTDVEEKLLFIESYYETTYVLQPS